jgi:hypothetical protein
MKVASALVLIQVIAFEATVEAQPGDEQRPLVWTHGSGTTFTLFPSGDLYAVYAADPHRPTNALTEMVYSRGEIEDTRSPRVGLAAGGRFGVLRIDPGGAGGRLWQISISAGLDAVFDSYNKLDAVGWDGNYGLQVTTAAQGPLSFKLAVLHQSSHLGDEYAERTGRMRLNYTREEAAVGVSWRLARQWRVYGETAFGYRIRYGPQEPWRAQAGLEYESRPALWGGRFAWYAAADFSSMEERAWRLDTSLQAGIVTRTTGHTTHRFGIGWTDGRPTIGEFFQQSEGWFTFGWWIDL